MLRPRIKELKKTLIALQIYQEMKTGAHSNAISLNNCVLKQYTVSGVAVLVQILDWNYLLQRLLPP